MRLIVKDCEPVEVQTALAGVSIPGASVLLNPAYLQPDPEPLWIACGAPAVKMVQSAGWIPKKGGVVALRGKLFEAHPDGWNKPIRVGVSYAPQVAHIDYANFVDLVCDLKQYQRFEKTGNMAPKLGRYEYTPDLSGVIEYVKKLHAQTGEPVELSPDLETMGLDPFNPDKEIVSISMSAKAGISDVVYTLGMDPYKLAKLIEQVKWLMTCAYVKTVGANFKFDMLWMRVKWGVDVTNFTFDTCNAGSLVEENRANTLNVHTKVYVPELGGYDDEFNRTQDKKHMEKIDKATLLNYAGGDTDACLQAYHEIRKQLVADNVTKSGKPALNSLTSLYINVIHPTLKAIHKMEYGGVCVDVEKFHDFGGELEGRMHETMRRAVECLPNSLIAKHGGLTEQGGAPLSKANMIAEFLFTPAGLNLKPLQTTELTGKPSTSEYHLTSFKDNPEAKHLLEYYLDYKRVAKMHGTYYTGFLSHLRADNRWHPSYIIHKVGDGGRGSDTSGGTVTGRGSATAPAFQCVTGDAEIVTRGGVQRASDIIDPHFPDDTLPIRAGVVDVWTMNGWQPTSNFFKSWRGDVLKITLQCGVALKCTPEHPILTRRGWKAAKDLEYIDRVELMPPMELMPSPEWATPSVAYALANIYTEGILSGTGTNVIIDMPSIRAPELNEAFFDLGQPLKPDFVEDRVVYRVPPSDEWTLKFCDFFINLPFEPNPNKLPFSFKGTDAARHFIRGIIHTKATKGSKYGFVNLRIEDDRLREAIAKEAMLAGVPPPCTTKVPNSVRWYWYSATMFMKWLGFPVPDTWRKTRNYDDSTRGFYSLQVRSIEPDKPQYVYDFCVPTTHNFTANGMLVHNTVPKHSYWGTRLRECIVAPDGHVIMGADYSQGELKVAACWAGEQNMIQAYKNGIDLHTLTASTVNAMSYEEAMNLKKVNVEAYKELRQKGKAGNFGLLYGMSAYGFMMYADSMYGVKMDIDEAEAMRDAFFELYPGLPGWHGKQISEALMHGFVRSPLGRTRRLHNISSPIKKSRKTSENQAINSPIQGTLVDMMWWSMGIVEKNWGETMVPFAQIHDQGLWYVPEDNFEVWTKHAVDVMENLPFEEKFGWKPELTFNVDAEIGLNLANLEQVKV